MKDDLGIQLLDRVGHLIARAGNVANVDVWCDFYIHDLQRGLGRLHYLAALNVRILDHLIALVEFFRARPGRRHYRAERILADLRMGRRGDLESGRQRFVLVRENNRHASRRCLPPGGKRQRHSSLRRAFRAVGDRHMDLAHHGSGRGRRRNYGQGRRRPHRKRGHHVDFHPLIAEKHVLHVAELNRQLARDLDAAGLQVEGGAEGAGREGHAEGHPGVEAVDGVVGGVLPVVVVEVGRGGRGALRDVHLQDASVGGILLDCFRLAGARARRSRLPWTRRHGDPGRAAIDSHE